MDASIRWGILGTGYVSDRFAGELREVDGAALVAVASRSGDRARNFAERHGAQRAHKGYEALAADGGIDAVYIGTPHSLHREHTVICLRAGKHVLCEKPLAINAAQAEEMAGTARETGLLLMEAMWTRFLPALGEVRRLVAEGEIGEVRRIESDFGFRAEPDGAPRLFDPALGGGALLDLGVYGISLAHLLLGRPDHVGGTARIGTTGVDEDSYVVLGYKNGAEAIARASIAAASPCEAVVIGTLGRIMMHAPWYGAERITVSRARRADETIDLPLRGSGFAHEIEAFMECIRDGRQETDAMPLGDSLAVMRTMDEARRLWDLRYPME